MIGADKFPSLVKIFTLYFKTCFRDLCFPVLKHQMLLLLLVFVPLNTLNK